MMVSAWSGSFVDVLVEVFAELKNFTSSIGFPVDYAVSVIPPTMPGYFAGFKRNRCVTIQGTRCLRPPHFGAGAHRTSYLSPAARRPLRFPSALFRYHRTVMAAWSDQAGGKSSTGIEPLVAWN
jgi:hypothetical protein